MLKTTLRTKTLNKLILNSIVKKYRIANFVKYKDFTPSRNFLGYANRWNVIRVFDVTSIDIKTLKLNFITKIGFPQTIAETKLTLTSHFTAWKCTSVSGSHVAVG